MHFLCTTFANRCPPKASKNCESAPTFCRVVYPGPLSTVTIATLGFGIWITRIKSQACWIEEVSSWVCWRQELKKIDIWDGAQCALASRALSLSCRTRRRMIHFSLLVTRGGYLSRDHIYPRRIWAIPHPPYQETAALLIFVLSLHSWAVHCTIWSFPPLPIARFLSLYSWEMG